jgi:HSP20 family protein
MFIVPVSRDSRAFSHAARFFAGNEAAARSPALDVAESNLAYTVQLEVPGVAKEDVKVTVEGRRVTVQAKHEVNEERSEKLDDKKGQGDTDRIVYRERSATSYSRSFTLPVEVDQAESQAKLENGVLTLTLPKRNARVPVQVTVN